ncbi:MAG: hypothetical protein JWM17_434 [Actinobacteria bacterium]|nr:hypothetical protein [Actinomycetota bacterium]
MDMREMMRCSKRVDPEPDLPMHFSFRCGITVVSKVVKPSSVTTNARITRPSISESHIARIIDACALSLRLSPEACSSSEPGDTQPS